MKINRKDAEKQIMNGGNPFGTFLVRSSETAEGGSFSLHWFKGLSLTI